MGLTKEIGKNERIRGVLCWVAAQYIRLVSLTGRWRVVRGDIPATYWDRGEPFIIAFWHGRLLMMNTAWRRGVPIHMLTSQHRDGQLIGRTGAHFGIQMAIGSSTRGGTAGIRAMLRALKSRECVGITPDGPKGPRMHASAGVVTIAKMSGCPIIPAAVSANPRKLMRSWDRFLVPRLFAEGVYVWGEPIFVPRDADESALEDMRLKVEAALNQATAEADRLVGVEPVDPA